MSKEDKKEKRRSEQKRLRSASKKASNVVVELRKSRANVSSKKDDKLELLPQRVSREELEPQKTELQTELSGQVDTQEQERHKLLVPNRKQHLKKIW